MQTSIQENPMGTVYLTGAGPGAVDLLTLRALRMIRAADAILYDRLINPDILAEVKDGCELIYVGKVHSRHTIPQDAINELLYLAAKKHAVVVRLKGGDPFVFGRGGEEGIYLRERGVAFEVIPGISSAVAVPAYAGIPVTHRGITVSFRVVTGHEAARTTSQIPWETFRADETIVFLMGLHRLEIIVSRLIAIGKPVDCPVAVISRGTRPDQRTVVGTLATIRRMAGDLPAPAIIIVGKVVTLREQLNWFETAV